MHKLDYWRIPFCCHKCRGTGHSRDTCKHYFYGSSLFRKEEEKHEEQFDEIENGMNFPIPMDRNLLSSFVGKFIKSIPVLLKFLSVDEILGFLSASGEVDYARDEGEVSTKKMGESLVVFYSSKDNDGPNRVEQLFDSNAFPLEAEILLIM